ncbi:MAG: hypothetical protein JNL18_06510 [Planctomycetaceae bacterium]|nr:hypothetical protein [Planctomycetaceae bacterium]
MKINNWRGKLAVTLAASGLLSPAAARAANLNTNLVVNPGFESTDFITTGDYGAPSILDWSGGPGFAYSHNPDVTSVPDYADGADPPGAGNWYFTANNNPGSATGDFREPGLFYQDIDVSTGPTAAAIAAGKGRVNLSAWMSSYLNDNDFGKVRVDYLDAGGASQGFSQISDNDPGPDNVWSQTTGFGAIAIGTAKLRVSLFGEAVNNGSDAYIDNVDVQVSQTTNPQFLSLEINTVTGQVQFKNQTGDAVQVDYYEIKSAAGSLKPASWTSLQDQNLASFPAGNGSGNGWEEAGGVAAGVLSESFLTGSSSVAAAASVSLGAAFDTAKAQDVVFRYAVVPPASLTADFDADGDADGADFLAWQRNNGLTTGATKAQGDANGDGAVNADDLAAWKSQFGGGGFAGPGVLVRGVVTYVGAGIAAVPEPTSLLYCGFAVAAAVAFRRRASS